MSNTQLRRYKYTCPLSYTDGTYAFNDGKVDVNLGKYWRILPASLWGSLPVYVKLAGTEWQTIDSSWQINPFGPNPTTISILANRYILSFSAGADAVAFTTDVYQGTSQSYWIETTDEMPPPGANPPRNRCELVATAIDATPPVYQAQNFRSAILVIPAWARRITVQQYFNAAIGSNNSYFMAMNPNWKNTEWVSVVGGPTNYSFGASWYSYNVTTDILPNQYRPAIDGVNTTIGGQIVYAGLNIRLDSPASATTSYSVWVSE